MLFIKKSFFKGIILAMLLLFPSISNSPIERNLKNQIISSFSIPKEEPIGYLTIPKLEINDPFYQLNSKNNTVSKNIEWIISDAPDKKYGNMILAGHSGNSKISYFQNLNQLMIGDMIFITYENKTYSYEVIDLYETLKSEMHLKRPMDETTVTLVTCVTLTNRRFLVVGKQI